MECERFRSDWQEISLRVEGCGLARTRPDGLCWRAGGWAAVREGHSSSSDGDKESGRSGGVESAWARPSQQQSRRSHRPGASSESAKPMETDSNLSRSRPDRNWEASRQARVFSAYLGSVPACRPAGPEAMRSAFCTPRTWPDTGYTFRISGCSLRSDAGFRLEPASTEPARSGLLRRRPSCWLRSVALLEAATEALAETRTCL